LASGSGEYLDSEDNTVIIWDLQTGKPAHILKGHASAVSSVAWSDDGQLASCSQDHTVIIWDLQTGEPAQTLKGSTFGVNSLGVGCTVAWSTHGHLASGSWNNPIIIWDLQTGKASQILRGPETFIFGDYSLAWSKDGRLASGSADNTVIVWDLRTGEPGQTLKGHASVVASVAWSEDGQLASGSGSADSLDDSVIIWDLQTSKPAARLEEHSDGVTSVAWSKDGQLASGSSDKMVKTARAYLAINPCNKIIRNMTVQEWLDYQGMLYVYRQTCRNLPVPVIDPVNEFRNYLIYANLYYVQLALKETLPDALITWKGRLLVLGTAAVLFLILAGILWLLYGLILLLRRRIHERFRRVPKVA
jgi:WD40 repeat protein